MKLSLLTQLILLVLAQSDFACHVAKCFLQVALHQAPCGTTIRSATWGGTCMPIVYFRHHKRVVYVRC